jgi:hypothetical protein
MDHEFKELIELLETYIDKIPYEAEESEFNVIEEKIKNHFNNEGEIEEKLQQAEIIKEKLKKIIALSELQMQEIKQASLKQNMSWGINKKYLETLQL